MTKRNKEYWRERQIDLQESLFIEAEDYTAEIEKGYNAAIRELERQISVWYQRFADNNGVDMVTAQRLLNNREFEELMWDVNEYIKHGEENAIDGRWMKELENASARVHISRFEALKLQTRQCLEQLYGGREQKVRGLLGDTYTGSLYGTGYEHFCRTGIETYFDRIDQKKLNQILNKAWTVDGKNFSERIWDNKQQLINVLNNEFTKAFTTGESPDKTIKAIAKKLDADEKSAKKLVMTESAYFSVKGQKDCYGELDVEEYEVIETLDSITCEECGSYDGKHYPVKSMQPGVNAPPFHPHCRGTTCPYFDDEFTEGEQRAARDEEGKTTYVEDMSYEEWKKKFVSNDQFTNPSNNDTIKIRTIINQRNTGKGNPNAILQFDVDLNNRQRNLLDVLDKFDSSTIVHKSDVNMKDLAALTAKTGDEFAMFSNGNTKLIIRGNAYLVNITVEKAKEMAKLGYKFSGHTHPGTDELCLIASDGDIEITRAFNQKQGVIYNSKGQYIVYDTE